MEAELPPKRWFPIT